MGLGRWKVIIKVRADAVVPKSISTLNVLGKRHPLRVTATKDTRTHPQTGWCHHSCPPPPTCPQARISADKLTHIQGSVDVHTDAGTRRSKQTEAHLHT